MRAWFVRLVVGALIYAGAAPAWPLVSGRAQAVYIAIGNTFLDLIDPPRSARVERLKNEDGTQVVLTLKDPRQGLGKRLPIDVHFQGYLPTVFLLALFLASGLSVRKMSCACLLWFAFLGAQVWLEAWWQLGPNQLRPRSATVGSRPGWSLFVVSIVCHSTTVAFLVPLALWGRAFATLRQRESPDPSPTAHAASSRATTLIPPRA
jgi:hypothetical protein